MDRFQRKPRNQQNQKNRNNRKNNQNMELQKIIGWLEKIGIAKHPEFAKRIRSAQISGRTENLKHFLNTQKGMIQRFTVISRILAELADSDPFFESVNFSFQGDIKIGKVAS